MKKRFKFSIIPLFAALMFSTIFTFSSCENLLNSGAEAMEEIEKVIDYANATSYVVRVKADDNTGVVTSVRDKSVKVTDEFEVSFQVASGYKFIKWIAVNVEDNSISMDKYVKIENPEKLETKVKLIKESDSIQIKPLCEQQFAITGSSVSDTDTVYPRDAKIEIVFNRTLAPENEEALDAIKITIPGLAEAKNYYQKPKIIDNKIVIFANPENLIPVPQNSNRTVTVYVPKFFFYKGNASEVYLDSSYSVSFVIDSTTTEKSTITYEADENGTLKVDGAGIVGSSTAKYSIGQSISLWYKKSNDFYFNGWQITDSTGKQASAIEIIYDDNEDTYGFDSETNIAQATILVVSAVSGIKISPSVTKIPTASIQLLMDEEDGIPGTLKVKGNNYSGSVLEYQENTSFTVTYKNNSDWYFKGWSNTNPEKVEITYPDNAETFGYDEQTGISTINVKVLGGASNVVIKPLTQKIPNAFIKLFVDEDEGVPGVIKVNGNTYNGSELEYKENTSFTVTYKNNSDWYFNGWSNTNPEKVEISYPENEESFGYDEQTRISTITVKVLGGAKDVVIKPIIRKIPRAFIQLLMNDEDGVPGVLKVNGNTYNGSELEYKENTSFTVTYKNNPDWYFNGWSNNNPEKVEISYPENEESFGYDEQTGISTINVKVLGVATDVIIKPITRKIPRAYIKLLMDEDEGVPGVIKVNGNAYTGSELEYKENTYFTVTYKNNSDWYFNGWSNTDPEKVEITYPDNAETFGYDEQTRISTITVKILGGVNDVVIKPITSKIPVASIRFLMDEEDGVPGVLKVNGNTYTGAALEYQENKTLTVTFKKNSDFYFKGWSNSNPEMVEITYPDNADTFGYDAQTGVSTIVVKIHGGVTDVVIKPITCPIPLVNIKFTTGDTDCGTLKVDGVIASGEPKSYKENSTINVTFRRNSNYYFKNWKITSKDGTENSVQIIYEDYDEETLLASATVFVKGAGNVTIEPNAPEIPYAYVQVKGEHGRISPDGKNRYKEKEEISLSFEADKDYCFTKWIVKTSTGADASKYVEIKNPDSALTTFVLRENPPSGVTFVITPIYVERAQYLSWTPLYTGSGVYRDSRIQIMFDHDMDPESIYYTETEQENLKNQYGAACLIFDDNGNAYGYTDGSKKYYKNISITDTANKSLLDVFDAPYFMNGNVLVIPTYIKKEPNGTFVRRSPASGTDIIVTVDENVFYREPGNNVAVKMSGSKKWNYLVNADVDIEKPIINVNLYAKLENYKDTANIFDLDDPNIKSGDIRIPVQNDKETLLSTKNDYSKYLLPDGILRYYGEFGDLGSGVISTFDTVITRITDDDYNVVGSNPNPIINTYNYSNGSSRKYIKGSTTTPAEIDVSSLEDGFYKVDFITQDINGNEGTNNGDYYFLLDRKRPVISKPEIEVLADDQLKVTWTNSSNDYKGVKIIRDDSVIESNYTGTAYTDAGALLEGNKYTYKMEFYDYAGNKTEYTVSKNTKPGDISNVIVDKPTFEGIKIHWDYPDTTDGKNKTLEGAKIFYEKGGNPTTASAYVDVERTANQTEGVYTFGNLDAGSTYNFIIYAYDNEGTLSEIASNKVTQNVIPNPVSDVLALTTGNSIKLTWKNPTGNVHHTKILYSSDSNFAVENTTVRNSTPGAETCTVSGLDEGTKYYFRLFNVDLASDGNESSYVEVNKNTRPAKIQTLRINNAVTSEDLSTVAVKPTWETLTNELISKVRVYYSDSEFTSINSSFKYSDSPSMNGEISILPSENTMKPGWKYYARAAVIDNEGNSSLLSDTVTYLVHPKSAVIESVEIPEATRRELTWTTPEYSTDIFKSVVYTVQSRLNEDSVDDYRDVTTGTSSATVTIDGTKVYYFRIKATYTLKEDDTSQIPIYSSEIRGDAVKPDAVEGVSVSISGTSATVSWNSGAKFVDGCKVYYGTSDDIASMTIGATATASETSKTITGLIAGTNYYFKVVSYFGSYISANASNAAVSDSCNDYTRPVAPVMSSTITTTSNTATVTWTAPETGDYTGYRLICGSRNVAVAKGETSYTFTGLNTGTSYSFNVVAYAGGYTSATAYNAASSTAIAAYTKVNKATISSITMSGTTATVNWAITKGTNDGLNGFKIYYGTTDSISSMTLAKSCGNSERKATITNLVPGKKYYFRVVSYAGSWSSYSAGNSTISDASDKYVKPSVASISSVVTTGTTAAVTWTKPSSGDYSGYIVYYGTTDGLANMTNSVTITDVNTVSKTFTGLTAGTRYYFIVVTYSGTWSSSTADNATISSSYGKYTTVTSASITSFSNVTNNSLRVNWTAPASGNYSGYKLYYGTTSSSISNMTLYGTYSSSTTYADVTGLLGATNYYFAIVTYSGTFSSASAENSTVSSVASKTTNVSKVTSFSASNIAATSLTLSWTYGSGNHSNFDIYYKDLSAGDTSYHQGGIYNSTSGSGYYYDGDRSKSITSTIITGLTPGHKYEFGIWVNLGTVWWDSNENSLVKTTVITIPDNLSSATATASSNDAIVLDWKYGAGDADGVLVQYKLQSQSSYTSKYYSGKTATITGLSAGLYTVYFTPYRYIDSKYVYGNSSSTTVNLLPSPVSRVTVASPSDNSNTSITLSWKNPTSSSAYSGVKILYGTSSTPTTVWSGSIAKGDTTATITGLSAGTRYYFKVLTYADTWISYSSANVNTVDAVSWYTAYNAPSAPTIYSDDGSGHLRVRVTVPNNSSNRYMNIYVDGTYVTYVYVSGKTAGSVLVSPYFDIPNYKKGTSYKIQVAVTHTLNTANGSSYSVSSPKNYMTYSNSSANFVIDGTQVSFVSMINVNTSGTQSFKAQTQTSYFPWTSSDYQWSAFNSSYGGTRTVDNYCIGKYEVCQYLYNLVMGTNPSNSKGNNKPVENVSWWDAILFCNKLSEKLGLTPCYTVGGATTWDVGYTGSNTISYAVDIYANGFRLPSAFEWELAARGGAVDQTTDFQSYYAGAKSTYTSETYRNSVAYNSSNSTTTTDVYIYLKANRLGLYNMSGNVYEWTHTTITSYDNGTFKSSGYNIPGANASSDKNNRGKMICCGGSYTTTLRCGVSTKDYWDKTRKQSDVGIRLCRTGNVAN